MGDWKAELDSLVEETMAFANRIAKDISHERPASVHPTESSRIRPLDLGEPEREQIRRRVESFRAHQERLMRERQDYAASVLSMLRLSRP